MSSTKRGAVREKNDFYETPPEAAQPVMDELNALWGRRPSPRIIDAGAGMGALTRAARRAFGGDSPIYAVEGFRDDMPITRPRDMFEASEVEQWRQNGMEEHEARVLAAGATAVAYSDYLLFSERAEIVVSNPPFTIAMEFLQHTIEDVRPELTAFLLRLNFLGSEARAPWMEENPPQAIRIITHRPDFTGKGGDSIEYAWMLWGDPGLFEGVEPIGWYR